MNVSQSHSYFYNLKTTLTFANQLLIWVRMKHYTYQVMKPPMNHSPCFENSLLHKAIKLRFYGKFSIHLCIIELMPVPCKWLLVVRAMFKRIQNSLSGKNIFKPNELKAVSINDRSSTREQFRTLDESEQEGHGYNDRSVIISLLNITYIDYLMLLLKLLRWQMTNIIINIIVNWSISFDFSGIVLLGQLLITTNLSSGSIATSNEANLKCLLFTIKNIRTF